MLSFTYTIKDELGIHARPAGLLAKEARNWKSEITIDNGVKKANVIRIMAVMGMGLKKGQVITVSAEGEDEAACIEVVQKFFEENL